MSHKRAKRNRRSPRPEERQDKKPLLSRRNLISSVLAILAAAIIFPFFKKFSERAADDGYDWMKEKLREAVKTNAARLSKEYPVGYQGFAIAQNRVVIVDADSTPNNVQINWDTAEVEKVTDREITVRIPDASIQGRLIFKGIRQIGPNRIGRWRSAFAILGWETYVEILETNPQYVIAVLGYTHADK